MARFLPDCGLLFQHIPRTGGTFVERVIDGMGVEANRWISKQNSRQCPKKHSLLSHYHRDELAKVRRIAVFVRHPVDYYATTWQYIHSSRLSSRRRLAHLWTRWRWHPFRQAGLLYKPDFCEWCEAVLEQEPAWATRLMAWYVGPEHGEFCDFIGRTETIAPDLSMLLTAVGHPTSECMLAEIGRVNESTVPKPEIPDELRQRICREERVLIRRFYSPQTEGLRWYRKPPRIRPV